MTHCRRTIAMPVAISVLLTALGGAPTLGQTTTAPASGRVSTRPAAEVLAQIGQSAGVVILADSTVQARLPVPTAAATSETVEPQIAAMVHALPAGTSWAKLYVPAPASGRWNADDVANFARAQARLVGTVGRTAPAGMVEILGRQIPATSASQYITALNLKLVYLVTNPRAPSSADAAQNWAQLTPEQRMQYAQQQAERIMALDPGSRVQALRDMMRSQEPRPQDYILKAVFSQLSEDERIALKQSFATEKRGGEGGK
jgi:hypothetical protein